jgi:hypothetical protein
MTARLMALAAALVAAAPAFAAEPKARVLEHKGRWESGYGAEFYNVVGRLQNTSGQPLAYVKLRIEALDAKGKVVASTETYNESAEALSVPDLPAKEKESLRARLKPLAAGAEERFRASFLKEETPAFEDYRVTVAEAPPVKR